MFRTVSIIGFLITFAGIALHCIASRPLTGRSWRPADILRKLICLLTLLLFEQRLSPLGILKKFVFLLALLCFVILVVTGFYPSLILARPISGYFIMAHATFAPVFALCVTFLALTWAHHHRFKSSDCPLLQQLLRCCLRRPPVSESISEKPALGRKICFWLIVLLALPVILSIVLGMFSFVGTDTQEFLMQVHRYSALILALVIIVYIYLIVRARMNE